MSKKKFYRTKVTFTILSASRMDDQEGIEKISSFLRMDEPSPFAWEGNFNAESEELSRKEMREALEACDCDADAFD